MTVMHQAVQDCIGQGRLAQVRVPGVHGQLTGDQCLAGIDAVIEDFEQICPILCGECGQTPVVQDDE